LACDGCATSSRLDFEFSMAFQPIYDAAAGRVWGYEALVRGVAGEGAHDVLKRVSPEQKYRFDQDCRVKAIELAARLFPAGRHGFTTAIDDFGAGRAGLGLLVDFQPDVIKIDMKLIRGIDTSPARQAVVSGIVAIARELSILVLAEGIETESEFLVLKAAGVRLFQGYWFAKPAFEQLPEVRVPVAAAGAKARPASPS
jgi:EAL domain-containing protein (putative c-di-GMP-specific phosphodiesterase class I)